MLLEKQALILVIYQNAAVIVVITRPLAAIFGNTLIRMSYVHLASKRRGKALRVLLIPKRMREISDKNLAGRNGWMVCFCDVRDCREEYT